MTQTKFFKTSFLSTATIIVATLLAFSPRCHAVVGYSTTFDDYEPGVSISENIDATTWATNDSYTGVTTSEGVTKSVGQSETIYEPDVAGDYWASLGGLVRTTTIPGKSVVKVYKDFSLVGGTGALVFNVDFSISSSNNGFPGKDSFAWALNDSAGNQLAALRFSPVTTVVGNSGDDNKLFVILDRAGDTSITAGLGITYNNLQHLTLTVSPLNKLNVSIAGTALFTDIDVVGSVVNPLNVTQVSANWIITNNTPNGDGALTGAGRNALNFNNYSVVPEPSSVALIGMAGLGGLVTMARRRKRMAK